MSEEAPKVDKVEESNQSAVKSFKDQINEEITAIWIDKLLDRLRKGYLADFFEKNEIWLTKAGLYGLYISGIIGLIISIVFPIRYPIPFGYSLGAGIVWLFLCIVAHYTAWKCLPSIRSILNTTSTQLSSKSLLDSFAVLTGIGGVISFFFGLYLWAKTSSFDSFIIGIFVFIFCEYMLALFLDPKKLNIEIKEKTSAGEEFAGLLSFFVKSYLKLIPILFGSGIIFGIINLIEALFMKIEDPVQIMTKASQVAGLTSAAFLPLIGYLLFLVYYFLIDIAFSILSIPQKLDKLK